MVDIELVSTIIFFIVVGLLLIYDRKNVQFSYGISIRRWNKGLHLIDDFVKKHRKIVTTVGNISAVAGVVGGIVGFLFLVLVTVNMQQAFGLVLPSVSGYQYPGPVLSIPFWYWIVGIFLIIATHESAHAIYSRLEGVKVKNYGIILLLLLPLGAFVDPDDRQMKKLQTIKKLRIFSAGSFTNLLTAALMFGLLSVSSIFSSNIFESAGVSFQSTIEGTPAALAEMSGTIVAINGYRVAGLTDFVDVLDTVGPGEVVEIATTENIYSIKTVGHPDVEGAAYIGISNLSNVFAYKAPFSGIVPNSVIGAFESWFKLLFWLTILSLGIGIANLLPMKPFDGGHIFEELLTKISKDHGKLMMNVLTVLTVSMILFNLFGIGIIKSLM